MVASKADCYINIKPNNLSSLTINTVEDVSASRTYSLADCYINGEYLTCELITSTPVAMNTIEIISDGYVTHSHTFTTADNFCKESSGEYGEYYVTLVSIKPEHLYAYTDPNASSETLYAWTVESDASINNGEITTIYTKTSDPILDTSTGNFTELFDKDGNSYGKNRSDIMSWTLTNGGTSGGETYVNSMDNSVIQLQAVGPT